MKILKLFEKTERIKLGYRSFIESFSSAFCTYEEKEQLITYAKQYFALNTDTDKKERLFPCL